MLLQAEKCSAQLQSQAVAAAAEVAFCSSGEDRAVLLQAEKRSAQLQSQAAVAAAEADEAAAEMSPFEVARAQRIAAQQQVCEMQLPSCMQLPVLRCLDEHQVAHTRLMVLSA